MSKTKVIPSSLVRLHVRPPVLENHKDDLKGLAEWKGQEAFPGKPSP